MADNPVKKIVLRVLVNLLVVGFSLTCVFPIVWTAYSSLKTNDEFLRNIIGLPRDPQFANYAEAFRRANMATQFVNSLFNSAVTILFVVIFALFIGYFISRYRFRGRSLVYMMFMAGMLVPIHGFLIPIYLQFHVLGLRDSRITLILPYVAFALPMAIFLFESFMSNIPVEVEEAAVIDGAGIVRRMFLIVLPMTLPILATILILTFLNTWNEFPFALVLIDAEALKTVPLGLTNFRADYSIQYPLMMAALTIASLPVILFYLFFSQKVMEGMTSGAVKG